MDVNEPAMYPASQPQQAFTHRLPLAKFSYTTTSICHIGPLNWNHLIGNGDLLFSMTGPSPGQVVLRVSRDHEILDEIDLAHLIREASNPTQSQKLSFSVIVRLPCLAIKYPSGTYTRRFQVKFTSDRDYYTALAILSQANCPFSESKDNPSQSGRKLTSSSSWNSALTPAKETHSSYNQAGPNSVTFPPLSSAASLVPFLPRPPSSSSSYAPPMQTDFTAPITSQNQAIRQYQPPQPTATTTTPPTHPSPVTTATTYYYDPEALERLLPPKRAMAFAKPGAKKPAEPEPEQQSQPQHAPKPLTTTLTPTDLTTYLSAPASERTASIENWICSQIEDEGFMQLCRDVEGVWRRVAFGKEV